MATKVLVYLISLFIVAGCGTQLGKEIDKPSRTVTEREVTFLRLDPTTEIWIDGTPQIWDPVDASTLVVWLKDGAYDLTWSHGRSRRTVRLQVGDYSPVHDQLNAVTFKRSLALPSIRGDVTIHGAVRR
jgi:hypothetical protein